MDFLFQRCSLTLFYSKISWSKLGAIAYVVDTTSVNITHLACVDGESWEFSSPYKITPVDYNGVSHPIAFLSWNSGGTDLTITDINGHLWIYIASATHIGTYDCKCSPNINKAPPNPLELNSVIGFKWLEPEKSVILMNPATLLPSFEQYLKNLPSDANQSTTIATYNYFHAHHYGPYIPLISNNPKQACIAVTRRGTIRLFTQGMSDTKYIEITMPVDKWATKGEEVLFSHASFAGTRDGTLILAAYSSQNENLYIYKVMLEWPALAAAASNRNNSIGGGSNHLAVIQVKRLLRTKIMAPDNNGYFLSHMLVASSALHNTDAESDAEIYVTFSSSRNDSIVQKFDLVTKPVILHNNFFGLSSQRDSMGGNEQNQSTLVSSEPTRYSKLVTNVSLALCDSFICTSFIDGTVDLKHRPHFSNIKVTNNSICSLLSIGFQLTPLETVTDVCISPTLASVVYLDGNGKLKISFAQNTKLAAPLVPGQVKASNLLMVVSALGLAVRHAAACFTSSCCDDLLYVMKTEYIKLKAGSPEFAEQFLRLLLRESYRAVSFSLDLMKDVPMDKLIVNPSLQRLLSMQVVLGTSAGWKRNTMARVAWCLLNMRMLSFGFTFTLRAIVQPRQHNNSNQTDIEYYSGYIMSMVGLSRWCIDFMAFVCQELYMSSLETDHFSYFKNKTSVPAAMMLGKVPRMFLIFSLRGVRGIESNIRKLAEQEANTFSGPAHTALRKIREITQQFSPVPLEIFERLTTDLDNSLNNIYLNLSDRLNLEHDLIFNAKVPDDFANVLSRTVEIFNSHIVPKINVSWLYYYDVSWLGLNEVSDEQINADNVVQSFDHAHYSALSRRLSTFLQTNRTPVSTSPSGANGASNSDVKEYRPHINGVQEIDYLRKQEMSRFSVGSGIRCRCVRCGERTVWHNPKASPNTYWTIACQKSCICSGVWIPLEEEK